MIINAAKEYAGEYNSSFLQDLYETGDVLYVSVDTLRDANLIDDIETNYQAVKIELLENDKITYELTNNIIDEIVITFNPNNGSVSPSTKTVIYGSVYGNLPTPTKSGWTFMGWYRDTTYTKKVNETDIVRISTPTALYAKYGAAPILASSWVSRLTTANSNITKETIDSVTFHDTSVGLTLSGTQSSSYTIVKS